MMDFSNIYMAALVLPFGISLLGILLIRFFAGEGLGHALASSAVSAALLAGLLMHFGLPALPPVLPADKIFVLILAAAGYGLLLDRFPRLPLGASLVKIALPVTTVFWIVGHAPATPLSLAEYRGLALLTILGTGLFLRADRNWEDGADIGPVLLAHALGLLAIGAGNGVADPGKGDADVIALVLTGALAGYLVTGLYKRAFPLGAAAFYPVYLVLLARSIDSLILTPATALPLLLLCMVYFSQDIAERLPLRLRYGRRHILTLAAIIVIAAGAAQVL